VNSAYWLTRVVVQKISVDCTLCLTASEKRLCQPALSDVIWLFFSPFTSVPAQ